MSNCNRITKASVAALQGSGINYTRLPWTGSIKKYIIYVDGLKLGAKLTGLLQRVKAYYISKY